MEPSTMKAIELLGAIDEAHRLQAEVPAEVPAGSMTGNQ
jgi:hypothetical protein